MAKFIRSKFGIDEVFRDESNGAVLAQGGKPEIVGPEKPYARPFDVLVLCAYEIQPELRYPELVVINAPMDDDYYYMPPEDVAAAIRAAKLVAAHLKAGHRVLSTCHHGRNRSGLVSAMSLVLAYEMRPSQAIIAVKLARRDALTNPQFLKLLMAAER